MATRVYKIVGVFNSGCGVHYIEYPSQACVPHPAVSGLLKPAFESCLHSCLPVHVDLAPSVRLVFEHSFIRTPGRAPGRASCRARPKQTAGCNLIDRGIMTCG